MTGQPNGVGSLGSAGPQWPVLDTQQPAATTEDLQSIINSQQLMIIRLAKEMLQTKREATTYIGKLQAKISELEKEKDSPCWSEGQIIECYPLRRPFQTTEDSSEYDSDDNPYLTDSCYNSDGELLPEFRTREATTLTDNSIPDDF